MSGSIEVISVMGVTQLVVSGGGASVTVDLELDEIHQLIDGLQQAAILTEDEQELRDEAAAEETHGECCEDDGNFPDL